MALDLQKKKVCSAGEILLFQQGRGGGGCWEDVDLKEDAAMRRIRLTMVMVVFRMLVLVRRPQNPAVLQRLVSASESPFIIVPFTLQNTVDSGSCSVSALTGRLACISLTYISKNLSTSGRRPSSDGPCIKAVLC